MVGESVDTPSADEIDEIEDSAASRTPPRQRRVPSPSHAKENRGTAAAAAASKSSSSQLWIERSSDVRSGGVAFVSGVGRSPHEPLSTVSQTP